MSFFSNHPPNPHPLLRKSNFCKYEHISQKLDFFPLSIKSQIDIEFFRWAIAAVFPRLSLPLARFNLDKLDFGQFGFKTPLWKQNRWGLFPRMMSMLVGLHIVTFGKHASQDWPWHMLLPMVRWKGNPNISYVLSIWGNLKLMLGERVQKNSKRPSTPPHFKKLCCNFL